MPVIDVSLVPDLQEATIALIEKAEASDVIKGLTEKVGLTEYQALAWTTEVQANGHLPSDRNRGQEAEGLSMWHRLVRGMCSDTFRDLAQSNPDMSRDEIRQNQDLRKLNAVRLGLRVAMGSSSRQARFTADRG